MSCPVRNAPSPERVPTPGRWLAGVHDAVERQPHLAAAHRRPVHGRVLCRHLRAGFAEALLAR
jgi:hypothetical protein